MEKLDFEGDEPTSNSMSTLGMNFSISNIAMFLPRQEYFPAPKANSVLSIFELFSLP
jgi:hypothetical protein